MPEKFLLDPAVILRDEPQYYETYVAFHYKRSETMFLTQEEHSILAHVYSGPCTAEEIAGELKLDRGKCLRFLKHMMKTGFVKEGDNDSQDRIPERTMVDQEKFRNSEIPFLSAPSSVDIFVTTRCNLRCVHCFADAGTRNIDLPIDNLNSIFDQLENAGVFEVRINGGEPLLHKDIDKVFLSLKGRRFRRVIITNGMLINEKIVDLLKESETIPTISLDDSEAQGHDSLRGVIGAFERTVESMRLLKKNGVEYGVNCCLHKGNLHRYGRIISFARKMGASKIAFLDLKPTGRMKENLALLPSFDEYESLVPSLSFARLRYRGIEVSLDTFLHCHPLKESVLEAKKGYLSCDAGKARMSIDADGCVYPCNLVLSDASWCIGDTNQERLSDIWFSEKWNFFRGRVKLNDLWKCRACDKLATCEDFYCRLLPYVVSGDAFAPHPKCG